MVSKTILALGVAALGASAAKDVMLINKSGRRDLHGMWPRPMEDGAKLFPSSSASCTRSVGLKVSPYEFGEASDSDSVRIVGKKLVTHPCELENQTVGSMPIRSFTAERNRCLQPR